MSKRFFPEHLGDRKRAKLDISISDHNFPLSQNNDQNKDADTWGDDNDDEILLLASQACEQAYSGTNISLLPDYSMCMQPESTSTQLNLPPSTSRTEFTFKKPSAHTSSIISTHLKEKCNRISSPLPGITSKMMPKPVHEELSDEDFIFSDKIFKGQDSDQTYRQLLQLQEENAKLKSENGKLLEKCVTKEGEASILRTQLKSCQVSVDNARLEKIKAQEKVQMEWMDKITAANNQMGDLRTQLDFKNLEIISIKEKCKKLESTKVRMTQVTVANNDISTSQRRQNHSFHNESMTQSRRVKVATSAAQTDDKAQFMVLNNTITKDGPKLTSLLPLIMEPSLSDQHSIMDYNEKLSRRDVPQKCRVYSTYHRIASTSKISEKSCSLQLSSVYEDLTCIASGKGDRDKYFNVFNAAKLVITEVIGRLEIISQRMTTAFQKEMDERYIESTSICLDVKKEDLLRGRSLFKEEQEILARRLIAMLAHILETSSGADMFRSFEISAGQNREHFLESISKICSALDSSFCATLYSGLLFSIIKTIQTQLNSENKIIIEIIKTLLASRPMPFVVLEIMALVIKVSLWNSFNSFCPRSSLGNLKMDYDQGVLLYRQDSCSLQVLLKQVEMCLKCIESQNLIEKAVRTTRQLIILYNNIWCNSANLMQDKSRCDCQLVLVQVIVYALRICAVMLNHSKKEETDSSGPKDGLLPLCRCGIQMLYQCTLRDVEFSGTLAHNEGHLMEFCEVMRGFEHAEVYANMLSELAGTLQSSPEEMPPSFHRQPWLRSFGQFSITD